LHLDELTFFEMFDLFMQWKIIDVAANRLTRSRAKPYNFYASAIYFISQLVDRDVAGSTYKDFTIFLLY